MHLVERAHLTVSKGMQEVLSNQLSDIQTLLQDVHPDFEHCGVGRANGLATSAGEVINGNEFNPVFFRRFIALHSLRSFALTIRAI